MKNVRLSDVSYEFIVDLLKFEILDTDDVDTRYIDDCQTALDEMEV